MGGWPTDCRDVFGSFSTAREAEDCLEKCTYFTPDKATGDTQGCPNVMGASLADGGLVPCFAPSPLAPEDKVCKLMRLAPNSSDWGNLSRQCPENGAEGQAAFLGEGKRS